MNKRLIVTCFTLILIIYVDGKKSLSGRSSGAGRGTSRKTNYNPQPVPTSLSYPQPSAPKPKPSQFGWQETQSKNAHKPKQSNPPNTQTHAYPPSQAKPPSSGGHSYPSSQTGMSGNNQAKPPATHQESVQKSSASQNLNGQQTSNNQPGQSYPASPGLSGSPGAGYPSQSGPGNTHQQGSNYPQGTGLSGGGAGAAPPPYPGNVNRQNSGGTYQNSNPGNTYQHPPPPPPYSSSNVGPNYGSSNGGYGGHGSNYGGYGGQGSNYGGYGGHGSYNNPGPQPPGYFGNYGNQGNKGYGGVGRSGGIGTLAGVGIAGAGVGTILTGLALWNLARSTGKTHHTVVYDNRGQPVAVAPENNTETDSFLADLVNCSLSISNGDNTEVLAIPCAIATSFRPDADVKDLGSNSNTSDDTKCTVTVVNKQGREFMTTISCAVLLKSAADNNVTEPPLMENVNMTDVNGTMVPVQDPLNPNQPLPLALNVGSDVSMNSTSANLECTPQPGDVRDPLNPCFAVTHNITVAPLETQTTEINEEKKEK